MHALSTVDILGGAVLFLIGGFGAYYGSRKYSRGLLVLGVPCAVVALVLIGMGILISP